MRVPTAKIESCGDVSCEFLVNPIPRPRPKPFSVKLKPDVPRVIFVDSGKPNSMPIQRRAAAILRERGHAVDEKFEVKESAGIPMPESLLGQLAQTKALVVSGVND